MFAGEGARLGLCTRKSKELLDETVDACTERAARAVGALCDVTDERQVSSLLHLAEREYGGVDVLINNATYRSPGGFLEATSEEWRLSVAVTLDGAYNACRAVLPGMVEPGWGRIINYSGMAGYRRGGAVKGAVKLGIVGFTRGLAREFGRYRIIANCIAPGTIEVDCDPGTEREEDLRGLVDETTPSSASEGPRRSPPWRCTSPASMPTTSPGNASM